jgi:hypothetical protein
VLLLLLCLVAVVALAGGGVSIDSWLIGGGGSTRTSAGKVSMGGALGQAIAGRSGSGQVDLQSGFWTGPRARSGQVHTIFVPVILADD